MGGTYSAPAPPPQTQPVVLECSQCSGINKMEVPKHYPYASNISPEAMAELSQLIASTVPKFKRDTLPIMIAAPIGFFLSVSLLAAGVPAAVGAVIILACLGGLGFTLHWRGFNRALDDELFNKVRTWNTKQAGVDVQYVTRNTEVCRAKGAIVYRALWFRLQVAQQQPQQPGTVPVAVAVNPAGQPVYQPQPGAGAPPYQPQPGIGAPPYQPQPGVGAPPYQPQPGVGAPPYQPQPGVGAPAAYPAYQQGHAGGPRVAYAPQQYPPAGQPAYPPATAQPATAPGYPGAQSAVVSYKPADNNGKGATVL